MIFIYIKKYALINKKFFVMNKPSMSAKQYNQLLFGGKKSLQPSVPTLVPRSEPKT